MDQLEEAKVAVPNKENNQSQNTHFDSDPPLGMVLFMSNPHCCIDHKEEVSVQKANVVQDECRSL